MCILPVHTTLYISIPIVAEPTVSVPVDYMPGYVSTLQPTNYFSPRSHIQSASVTEWRVDGGQDEGQRNAQVMPVHRARLYHQRLNAEAMVAAGMSGVRE